MKPFGVKSNIRRPVKKPFVQEQLRIEIDDCSLWIKDIPKVKQKEEERRGIVILDVF